MRQGQKAFLLASIVAAGTALVIEGHPWWVLLAIAGWTVVANA